MSASFEFNACSLLLAGYARTKVNLRHDLPDCIVQLCVIYAGYQILHQLIMTHEFLSGSSIASSEQKLQRIRLILDNIRQHILIHGFPDLQEGHALDAQQDTLRGKLWRIMLGVTAEKIDSADYQSLIVGSPSYDVIRPEVNRLLKGRQQSATLESLNVDEKQLIRILNAKNNANSAKTASGSGITMIAAMILETMPELYAYYTLTRLLDSHLITYFGDTNPRSYRYMVGCSAGSTLAGDILRVVDAPLFEHIFPAQKTDVVDKNVPPYVLFNPFMWGILATICKPRSQVAKVWDFLFCFGVHLLPITTVALVMAKREEILSQTGGVALIRGSAFFNQRKMYDIDASIVTEISMDIICKLKGSEDEKEKTLWSHVLQHASDFEVALEIKLASV